MDKNLRFSLDLDEFSRRSGRREYKSCGIGPDKLPVTSRLRR